MNPDIVCVQELDKPDYVGSFGFHMDALGYSGVFKKRRFDIWHGMAIFYRRSRVALVRECPVPCPDRSIIQGVENAGVMLVLEVSLGSKKRRLCVATTHMLNGCDTDLKRLGQLVSIMAAAETQLRMDPAMPLILTGDFNSRLESRLIEFVTTGRTLIHRPYSNEVARRFKTESWDVRDPSASVTTVRNDVRNRLVSHSVHTASVYDVRNIVDHIFYGQAAGESPRLEVVSRLELPESLARLKNGLPAAHLGSDHFALAAKFCSIAI